MTVNQPSQDPNKDAATSAWEQEVTQATNRMQHQIDNINESVVASTPTVAIYSKTQDGEVQQFTPFADGDGFVAYFKYTDELPTLPVSGLTFSAYSDEEIDVIIKQYIEQNARPTNPGTTSYQVSGGVWNSSSGWTKTKLDRAGINIWFSEARIKGQAGQTVTAKWSNAKLLYGGAVASGILYYNTAQTSAPSAPPLGSSGAVIDGYDYDSGVFSLANNAALSTIGWQYVPITVAMSGANSINKKHWQVTFHVETAEATLQDGTTPGQIITFGTVEGFIPIGSVLQSDNYSGSGTLAGWQIDRSGNADFNNVNVRGNSTVQGSVIVDGTVSADAINVGAGGLSAIDANIGTITAGTINGGTINAANVSVSGGFSAPQLAVGVIMQIAFGTYSRGSQNGNGSDTVCTLTATQHDDFNTRLLMIANCRGFSGSREGTQGNYNDSTFSTSIQVSGSNITTTGASCSATNSNQTRAASRTLATGNLTKGSTYTVLGSTSGSYNWGGSGDCILLEVKI